MTESLPVPSATPVARSRKPRHLAAVVSALSLVAIACNGADKHPASEGPPGLAGTGGGAGKGGDAWGEVGGQAAGGSAAQGGARSGSAGTGQPAAEGDLEVDAATTTGSFAPAQLLGLNLVPNVTIGDYTSVLPKLERAQLRFLRFPSGSADDFHWNGKGTLDSQGSWVPDPMSYGRSFHCQQVHRGTTSSYSEFRRSMLTDGNPATRWVSHPDTDRPDQQWAYVDLGAAVGVDSLTITWGSTPAKRFSLQVWNPSVPNQWAPYLNDTEQWLDVSTGVAGAPGEQVVTFPRTVTRHVRLLLQESGDPTGQYSVAELRASEGAIQRTVNGGGATASPAAVSSTDTACGALGQGGWDAPIDFEEFMAYAASLGGSVKPLISVNFGGGTPEEAASWVRYANLEKGYALKHWEIGNELNGTWETGGPLGAGDYARRYLKFYDAMKAVDPSILIGGPGVGDAFAASNDQDGKTYLQGFMDRLAADPKGNRAGTAEFIDFHWYPYCGHESDAAFANCMLANTGSWRTLGDANHLSRWLAPHPAASTVPLFISEWNSGGNAGGFSVGRENGVWIANTLGELLSTFGARAYASYWTVLANGANAVSTSGGTDQGLLSIEAGPGRNAEHASYWALWLIANEWFQPGTTEVHRLVASKAPLPGIASYATVRPDGELTVLVINRDATRSTTLRLVPRGFPAGPTASVVSLDERGYAWDNQSLPRGAKPNLQPLQETVEAREGGFVRSFGPSSVTVLRVPQKR